LKKKNWQIIACLALSFCGYLDFGYALHRENFLQLASVYIILFAGYIFLVRRSEEVSGKIFLIAAIVFRLSFLFSFPTLSDDYFRFVWDGTMLNLGVNPYTVVPSTFISHLHETQRNLWQLYQGMNSQHYFTVYPPVLQYIFGLAGWVFPESILGAVLLSRAVIITADIASIILMRKLLNYFQLPKENVWWYALNPLVIIELTGNLHFEAVMIFFLLLAIYLLVMKKNWLSAIAIGLAVSTKLIPLLFLPFIIRRMKLMSIIYFFITALICTLLFLPFLDKSLITNLGSSIDLYFQKFEFNASIFYIIRWIGFQSAGYDIINQAGPLLALTVFLIVIVFALKERNLTTGHLFLMMQLSLLIYFLFATTVHPWYLVSLVMLSVFTGFRFPIIWSLFVILSYSAYVMIPAQENFWFIAFEYAAVGAALSIDLLRERSLR